MAAVNDCFTIGSTVLGTTCFNEEVEGEVLAFDHNTKMLILNKFNTLECRSKNSEKLSDVHVLNLSLCSNVQVIKECNGNFIEDPQKLSLEQLKRRLRKTVQHRQTYLKSKNADVSPEGQELYRVIAKQFKSNEVSWVGPNIQVFNEVTITPPYKAENVKSNTNNQNFCNYIKKMIEQFMNARQSQENNSFSSSTSNVGGITSSSGSKSTSTSSLSSSTLGQSSSSSTVAVSTSNMASASPVSAN